MRFKASQHARMADLHEKKAAAQCLQKKSKLIAMAKVYRTLARRAEARECKVTDNEPPLSGGLISEPGMFDSIEIWEHWLAEVEAMADFSLKQYAIYNAKRMIEHKRQQLRGSRDGVPWMQ